MAEYKGIHGTKVQDYTTDPANPIKGQVWYNETANTLRVESATTVGAWSTGGSLNTGRYYLSGAGVQTSSLAISGELPAGPDTVNVESYDGTSWTEVANVNVGRRGAGAAGIANTAALFFSGYNTGGGANSVLNESWNGTSWTEVNDLNTARRYLGGDGIVTSALAFGGFLPPNSALTESYNGTSWTEVNDLNTARYSLASAGSSNTNALAVGGNPSPSARLLTELWNGSSWTEVGDTSTSSAARGGAGDTSSALVFGGGDPNTANTELWNGSAWSETTNLNTAREGGASSGTATSALFAGGTPSPQSGLTVTEEWTGAGAPAIRTITTD